MSTPRTSVKMAALAPMPSASVMITTNVNPGDLRSWRRANLRSFISFGPQRLNRIAVGGAPCRQQTREQSRYCEQGCCGHQQQRIMRGNLIQLRSHQPAERERRDDADREPAQNRRHSLPNDKLENIACLRS